MIWALAGLVTVGLGLFVGFGLVDRQPEVSRRPVADNTPAAPAPVPTATATAADTITTTTTEAPTAASRLVTVGATAAQDYRAAAVAGMFEVYFTAINNRDMATAASVYDPRGVLDPGNTPQVERFARAVSTTTDSDVIVHQIGTDPTDPAVVLANLTFVSRQDPDYGPKGRTNETCTVWDITYTLTDAYRIHGSRASSSPC